MDGQSFKLAGFSRVINQGAQFIAIVLQEFQDELGISTIIFATTMPKRFSVTR